jgi:hypothetical protein
MPTSSNQKERIKPYSEIIEELIPIANSQYGGYAAKILHDCLNN